MNAAPPPPPPSQRPGALPEAPWARPRRTYLGIDSQIWLLAWLPVLPSLFLAILAPEFLAPLLDPRVAILGVPIAALVTPLMVALNLVAAQFNRTLGYVTIALTATAGLVWAILGPAVVLIAINLSA